MKCRACLKIDDENTTPLNEYYVICFNLITSLNIHLDDNKPQHLCENCLGELICCISFREKCIYSESKLIETEIIDETKTNALELKELKEEDIEIKYAVECDEKFEIKGEVVDENEVDEAQDVIYEDNYVYDCAEGTGVSLNFEEQLNKKKVRKKSSKIKRERSHRPVVDHECGLCMEKCSKSSLYDHVESHKNSNTCTICLEEYKEWSMLLLHRIKHLPTTRLFCHICMKYVKCPESLEIHYNIKHFGKNPRSVLQCQDCTKSYTTLRGLQKHKWDMHSGQNYVCDICSKDFNCKKMLVYHIKTGHSVKARYICQKCDYTTNFPSNFKQHTINKHTPDKVYCKKCKKSFENQSKYGGHKCNSRQPIVCPICGIVLSRHSRLNRHLLMHTSERKHKCPRCPASYKSKGALDTHLDKHEGRRTRRCEFCPASFYELSALIRHRRTHTGEKPYVCKICQKAFGALHNLKVHMQVHGEYIIKKRTTEDSIGTVGEIFKLPPSQLYLHRSKR